MLGIKNKLYKNAGNSDVLILIEGVNQTILDVGCGVGDNARILKANQHIVDGITISENELELASEVLRNGYLHDLENGLPTDLVPNVYDYVICSHVLEHICYPERLFNDLKRVLKTTGYLIVALPNLMHYKSRIQLAIGNFNYHSAGVWDNTHFRWYTFATGKRLLENNGFYVLKATVTGEVPFKSILKVLPENVLMKTFILLTSISKGFFGYQLLYKAKPQN